MVNVLVVDDDELARERVCLSLRHAQTQFAVTQAEDGREAIKILRGQSLTKHVDLPVLILLDLIMPHIDGFEFLRELRQDPMLRYAPVFVLTSSDEKTDKACAYNHGISGYMVKSEVGPKYQKMTALLEGYASAVSY